MLPGEDVTILAPTTSTDRYGNTVETWDPPTEVATVQGLCEPRPSGEPLQDARNQVTSGFTLYLPAGTVVTPSNRVRIRGVVYAVEGQPADWRMGAYRPGVVVQTTLTEG